MRRRSLVLAVASLVMLGLTSAPSETASGTPTTSPARVTSATANSLSSTRIALRWHVTSDRTVIRMARGAVAPSAPSRGKQVATVSSPRHRLVVKRLVPGTQYSFALFAMDTHGNAAQPRAVRARTAPAPVIAVKTYDVGTNVSVEWTNPATPFRRLIVRYAEGPAAPKSPSAGKGAGLRRPNATSVTLHRLAKGTTYSVAVWTRGETGLTSRRRMTTFATAANPPASGTVSGTVTDDVGDALAGASVFAFDLSSGADFETTSSSSGGYSFRLPPSGYDIGAFGPNATGGDSDATGYDASAQQVRVHSAQHTQSKIALPPGGVVVGKVTDAQGDPVAGVLPELIYPPTYLFTDSGGEIFPFPDYEGDPTAADGSYEIRGVSSDSFVVCFDPTERSGATQYAAGCLSSPEAVAPGATEAMPDDALAGVDPAGGGSIAGTIRDADGHVVGDAQIYVTPIGKRTTAEWLFSNSDGTYEGAGLAPGRYRICVDTTQAVMTGTGAASGCRKKDVAVTSGQLTRADVTLPVGAAFEGVVSGPDGRPVVHAAVVIEPNRNEGDYVAFTDATGHYVARGVGSGPLRVCIDATGAAVRSVPTGALGHCFEHGQKISFRAGKTQDGIDFQLKAASAISIAAVRADGAPVRYAEVDIQPTDGHSNIFGFGYTNAHGEFLESGLPAGTYFVCVTSDPLFGETNSDGASDTRCTQQHLVQTAIHEVTKRVMTFAAAGSIRVEVHDTQGRPVPGIDAVVLKPCADQAFSCVTEPVFNDATKVEVRASANTYSDGTVRLDGLHPGTYAVCVSAYWAATTANDAPTGYADACTGDTFDVTVHKSAVNPVKLTLQHGGAISGTVTDAHGNPIRGARIRVTGSAADDFATPSVPWNFNFTPGAGSASGADGTFTIRSIQPGAQRVCVTAKHAKGTDGTVGYRQHCLSSPVTVTADSTHPGVSFKLKPR